MIPPDLWELLVEHLVLVGIATGLAILIGVPLGIVIAQRPVLQRWTLGFANTAQTIPSLALLGFLLTVPVVGGIGQRPAIVALVLYALLPILRNTVTGLAAVDAAVKESAVAMGMTDGQVLRQVELPLAAPSIMAGVRIATVTTVGTATIAAAIGGGGLGVLIFRGLSAVNSSEILAGALPAAVMALAADGGLEWVEKRLSRRR
jgi:osmoprotectant transport system permease protein